jgi:tetratricopeptide (TPR) repeat protein
MYPEAADKLRINADRLATQNFEQQHYREAASLAAQSLELKPGQREALIVLAKAQFALGNFSPAAAAYRKLLDQDPSDISLVRSYADALSAANPTMPTAQEFQTWLTGIKAGTPALATQMQIELAGLMLMTGNDTLAKSLAGEAQEPDRGPVTPESLGRLGWWYYRSGDYAKSATMLRQAVEQRPGVLSLQTAMAWNELEQHQLDNAIRRFTAAVMDMEWNSPVMGRAVASWQAHHTEDALKDFETVAKTFPEWRNPHWVDALYPASVARTVAQMQAEWENRQAARHRNPPADSRS